jgi:transposase InsO family protein
MARLVVTAVFVEGRSKSEVARQYGVSRRWVITLCQRYLVDGDAGLEPRSRRPHRSPHRVPVEVEDQIVEIRKRLDRDGREAGAETIAFHLQGERGSSPAVSTIWRILTDRGFVTAQPKKRPKSSHHRFQAEQPNERWQLDVTHWQLADGPPVEILDIIDDHSRLCVASQTRATFTARDVDGCFRDAAATYGDPAGVLSDNGTVFTVAGRGGGLVALEVTLASRGISFRHSRAYHPQTCGKVERFHQTVKKWLATQPPAADLVELQRQLDELRSYYNEQRPHRALNRRTPHQAYLARPKAIPVGTNLRNGRYRVLRRVVDRNGVITVDHASRQRHIALGRHHTGTPVIALVYDLDTRVINHDGQLIRSLTLDPTKDYQPLAKP